MKKFDAKNQQTVLIENLKNPECRLIAGYHNGISGETCLISSAEGDYNRANSTVHKMGVWPVTIANTTTPAFFTSSVKGSKEGGQKKATDHAIEQAELLAELFNTGANAKAHMCKLFTAWRLGKVDLTDVFTKEELVELSKVY